MNKFSETSIYGPTYTNINPNHYKHYLKIIVNALIHQSVT